MQVSTICEATRWPAAVLSVILMSCHLGAQTSPGKALKVDAGFHQMEDGPRIPQGGQFVPGETVFYRALVAGFATAKDKQVKISYKVEALDKDNVPLVEPVTKKIEETLSEQDKDWRPIIRHSFLMPPFAFSGTYTVRLTVKDEIAGSEATLDSPFAVRGHAVEPSETMVIRNFQFFRAETDTIPLKIAAFRPGDELWAKFDVVGYKMAEGNQIHIEYTIAIADGAGRVLFKQQDPVVEKSQSFYPKKYVPCTLNLTIQPKTAVAEYQLKVYVTDHTGKQNTEGTFPFRIE